MPNPSSEFLATLREAAMERVVATLGDACDCTNDWSAWDDSSMSDGDFASVADNQSRVAEIVDATLEEVSRVLATEKNAGLDALREASMRGAAEGLREAYDCMRVWSAWSYRTMSETDFVLVAEDDSRLRETAEAVADDETLGCLLALREAVVLGEGTAATSRTAKRKI